jgi:hypothetical protein
MSKKTFGGFLSALALGVAAVLSRGGSKPAPPAADHTAEWTATCEDVYRTELGREIDRPGGLNSCLAMARSGKDKAGIVAVIDASPEHAEYLERQKQPPAPVVTIPRLTADGRIFRADGEPWRYKGVSAFQLLDRFAKGEDIQPFLDAYQGLQRARGCGPM